MVEQEEEAEKGKYSHGFANTILGRRFFRRCHQREAPELKKARKGQFGQLISMDTPDFFFNMGDLVPN